MDELLMTNEYTTDHTRTIHICLLIFLVQIANPADDTAGGPQIDKVLFASCQGIIEQKCHEANSQYDLLSCLMRVCFI